MGSKVILSLLVLAGLLSSAASASFLLCQPSHTKPVAVVFLVLQCFLRLLFFLLVSRPAVIGHSCCGVPANILSVCLFVCLFWQS